MCSYVRVCRSNRPIFAIAVELLEIGIPCRTARARSRACAVCVCGVRVRCACAVCVCGSVVSHGMLNQYFYFPQLCLPCEACVPACGRKVFAANQANMRALIGDMRARACECACDSPNVFT